MEESLATDRDVERNIRIRLRAARIVLLVLYGWNAQQVPLNTRVELLQVDADLERFQVADAFFLLHDVLQIDLQLPQQTSEQTDA